MDIIDRHFAAENAHDVAATLATYTEDIVWDDVTHPDAPFHGKDEVGAVTRRSSTPSPTWCSTPSGASRARTVGTWWTSPS